MAKKIWIINQYAGTPKTGNPARHYSIAKELSSLGYEVSIISASFTHRRKLDIAVEGDFYLEQHEGVNYFWVSVPSYKKTHGIGRILNWFLFSQKIKKIDQFINDKPDLIYYSSLSLIGYLGASYLKKKYKVPLYFEVRDIWPLTLQKLKGLKAYHPLVWGLKKIEIKALSESELIISNLTNFQEYLNESGYSEKRYLWLPNGIDKSLVSNEPLMDNKLSLIEKKEGFKVGYAGSIGVSNNLPVFINAANKLQNINFFIAGDGPERKKIEMLVKGKNVYFLGRLPKSQVNSFLQSMNTCYIGWTDSELYKYGIGANKIADYFNSGRPVLHSYSGGADPVAMFNAGITTAAGDVAELVKGILYLESDLNIQKTLGFNAQQAAEKTYNYTSIVKVLHEALKKDLS